MKRWLAPILTAVAVAALTGCAIPPTPYQPQGAPPRGVLGYQSTRIDDALIRVEFQGNTRTATRAVEAYTLYRAAEVAKEANAPAFSILEGSFDRQILDDTDIFSRAKDAGFEVEDLAVSHPGRGDGPADSVVQQDSALIRTRGYGTRAPPPPPRPAYAPALIYVPTAPIVLPRRSLLIRLLPDIPAEPDNRSFATQTVLDRLGPRIVRPGPKQ